MMDEATISDLIKKNIADASVTVWDITGTRDHWGIKVVSDEFKGKTLIDRHKMLHAILEEPMQGAIHAIKLKTLTHAEDAQRKKV